MLEVSQRATKAKKGNPQVNNFDAGSLFASSFMLRLSQPRCPWVQQILGMARPHGWMQLALDAWILRFATGMQIMFIACFNK